MKSARLVIVLTFAVLIVMYLGGYLVMRACYVMDVGEAESGRRFVSIVMPNRTAWKISLYVFFPLLWIDESMNGTEYSYALPP